MEQKVRVSICRNGNQKDARVVVVALTWDSIMKAAANKFRMKPSRLFASTTGQELTDKDFEGPSEIVKVN